MSWRVARSLDKLLAQINAEAPNRSKAADGAIGDTAHAASVSDHNPDGYGIVRARDFTDDAAGGMDALILREQLRKSHDPRIKYVISEGKMFSSYARFPYGPFEWRPYSGSNGHFHHLHLSVVADSSADDTSPWAIDLTPSPASSIPNIPKPKPTAPSKGMVPKALTVDGDRGPSTYRMLQAYLNYAIGAGLTVDGDFGPATKKALEEWVGDSVDGSLSTAGVKALQRKVHAKVDGDWGPATTRALQLWLNNHRTLLRY